MRLIYHAGLGNTEPRYFLTRMPIEMDNRVPTDTPTRFPGPQLLPPNQSSYGVEILEDLRKESKPLLDRWRKEEVKEQQ